MMRTRSFIRSALVAAAVAGLLAPLPTLAQDQAAVTDNTQPEQPVFRARVNLVRVDVSVFGRDGEPLVGLGPADFLVKEDGIAQKVETVQFVTVSGRMPGDRVESTAIRSAEHAAVEAAREDVRLFVLFLDDYHVDKSPTVMIPLKRTLNAFVDRLGPYDLVAVMDPLTPLTHVEFTRDHNRVREIVNKFEGRRGELFPVRSAAEEAQQTQRNIWELRGGVTLDAMNAIVTKLGGMREGRKSVIFVSQGPPVNLRSTNWMRMEDVVQSANRGNVTIHTIDPRPLGSSPFGGNLVLRRFSDETGGRAIFNTNDHAEHLEGIFTDASAYYLIGYAPSRGDIADGKFHQIDVEVKQPRVRVVARRGYWSPKAAELNAPTPEPIAEGVMNALSTLVEPKSGSTAEVWVGFSKGAEETNVTIAWEPVPRRDEPATTRVDVERLTPDGTPIGEVQQIPKTNSDAARGVTTFPMASGTTILRFTSLDATGQVLDRWAQDVTVPALAEAELALATPKFLVARSPFEFRALQAPDAAPSASRRLRKSDRLLVEITAYSKTATPEITVELLNRRGERLVSLPVPPAADGEARVEIPLQSLARATYVLKVTATAGSQVVEQHAPFVIVP